VIATAIIAVAFVGIIGFFVFAQGATLRGVRNAEATSLAEEAMEAVRKLRDESWTTNIVSKAAGTTYYPNISSNKWVLQTTNPLPTSFYTTTIVFSNVNRDASSNIATSGSNDANTRKVVVTVTWRESGVDKTVPLTAYITNFLNN
jgi:hypothetical protein